MFSFDAFVQAAQGAPPQAHLIVSEQQVQRKEGGAPTSRAENQAAWRCFQQALANMPRREEIDRRYHIKLAKHLRRGDPLLPEHIRKFGVGLADVHVKDLISRSEETVEDVRNLPPQAVAERVEALNVARFVSPEPVPTHWHHAFIPDLFRKDQHRLLLLTDVVRLPAWDAYLELLAKKVVQYEMDEGTLIPAPSPSGGIEYYEAVKKIGSGAGLVAYMFRPVSSLSALKPLLVFRPTQFHLSSEDAVQTLLNDLEPIMGHTGYLAAKEDLDELMRDPAYQNIEAAGFSLGGVHLQRFLVDHYAKVTRAVFFNDPGVDPATAAEYAERVNRLPLGDRVSLVFYRTVGDRCHYFGRHHVGRGISHPNVDMRLVEIHSDHRNVLSARALHTEPMLHDPASHVTVCHEGENVHAHLDSSLRGPQVVWYEDLRQSLGGQILFALINLIYSVAKSILDCLGIQIFRSSLRGHCECADA